MTNRPFDQLVVPSLQRPLSSDLNQLGSLIYYTMLFQNDVALRCAFGSTADPAPQAPFTGFYGGSFRPYASGTDLTVTLEGGLGMFYDPAAVSTGVAVPSGQPVSAVTALSAFTPLVLKNNFVFTAPTPDATLVRYDIIEVRNPAKYADSTVLDFFDIGSSQFVPGPAFKTFTRGELDTQAGYQLTPANPSTAGLSYKVGVPGAGVPPSTTAGYERVAVITVGAAVTTLDGSVVRDDRRMTAPGGQAAFNLRARISAPTGGFPDTLDGLGGTFPPGVRVTSQLLGSNPAYWRFYFFAGRNGTVSTVNITPQYEVSTSPELNVPVGYLKSEPFTGTVDSTLQGQLAGGSTVYPAIDVAIGQQYCAVDVVLTNYKSVAVPPIFVQDRFPTPTDFGLSGVLQFG